MFAAFIFGELSERFGKPPVSRSGSFTGGRGQVWGGRVILAAPVLPHFFRRQDDADDG